MRKIKMVLTAATTRPGYSNGNGQIVVRDTGVASEARAGQRVYEVRCSKCDLRYGISGIDIEKRLCPGCQNGVPAEPVREQGPRLFE